MKIFVTKVKRLYYDISAYCDSIVYVYNIDEIIANTSFPKKTKIPDPQNCTFEPSPVTSIYLKGS